MFPLFLPIGPTLLNINIHWYGVNPNPRTLHAPRKCSNLVKKSHPLWTLVAFLQVEASGFEITLDEDGVGRLRVDHRVRDTKTACSGPTFQLFPTLSLQRAAGVVAAENAIMVFFLFLYTCIELRHAA